jgi:hypothetical protein
MDFKGSIGQKGMILLGFLVILTSCKAPLTGGSGNYIYKTECMGAGTDGTLLVKAWGTGASEKEAVEQAKIKALKDFLFSGIREGKADCGLIPLLREVNVYEKNETYFTDFFSKRGNYADFVKTVTSKKDMEVKPARSGVTVGLLVRILQVDLKQKITKDYNQLKH